MERLGRLQRWSDFAMERLQRKGRKISVKISLIPAIRQASVSSVFYFGQRWSGLSDGAEEWGDLSVYRLEMGV
ncbi:MAG: hypothetical protein IPN08_10310 [Bacteroidales bacterium]|nr:hypothetical protein [Bacteroidales bacterium]